MNLTHLNPLRPWLKPFSFLHCFLLSLVMTVGMLEFNIPKALSQQTPYFCAQLNGEWHTFKRFTRRDDYNFITWQTWNLGLSPRDRCIEVSKRFNTLQSQGMLNTLQSGIYNGYPVVCAGYCERDTVIATWELGSTNAESAKIAAEALNRLTAIVSSGFGAGRILNPSPIETDFTTGNQFLVQPDGTKLLLLEITPTGTGILYWQDFICAVDPNDPTCW